MREIIFDTETTGLSFSSGDRLVEIGCIEMVNRVETGRTFHAYVNPGQPMPAKAQEIHGLSDAFLADKPLFSAVVDDLLDFITDSPLVAHNAGFDFAFLNGELKLCGRPVVAVSRMIDTLAIAKVRHPGAKHSLDALCGRFGIDQSRRVFHGALLDAQLLSQVYVELTGGRQIGLGLVSDVAEPAGGDASIRTTRPLRIFTAAPDELSAHAAFVATLKSPLWIEPSAG